VFVLPSSQSTASRHATQLPAGPQRGALAPHAVHAVPARPQRVSAVPVRHTAPSTQPVQHAPLRQLPASAATAQLAPSVSLAGRLQVSVCGSLEETHSEVAASHWKRVSTRLRVPARSQASPPKSQLVQSERSSAGQSLSVTQPTHACRASLQVVPAVQGSPKPGAQALSAHVSKPSQKTPSSQRAVLGTCAQPVAEHRSSVHALPSSQSGGSQMTPLSTAESISASTLLSDRGALASSKRPPRGTAQEHRTASESAQQGHTNERTWGWIMTRLPLDSSAVTGAATKICFPLRAPVYARPPLAGLPIPCECPHNEAWAAKEFGRGACVGGGRLGSCCRYWR